MTTPTPTGFQPAQRLGETISALLITGTSEAIAISQTLEAAAEYGYMADVSLVPQTANPNLPNPDANGPPIWQLHITNGPNTDQYAYQGYWIVIVSNQAGTTLTFYTAADFANRYTTNQSAGA